MQWQCRWSPTIGSLEKTHNEIWGTVDYTDNQLPTVFFGLYGLPDFMSFRAHRGEKHILWAGSDITNFINGYWLDDEGKHRLNPRDFASYLNEFPNWVENEVEAKALKKVGVRAKIAPSYLGEVNQPVRFSPGNKLYTSVSGDNFKLYGWDKISGLAHENPDIEFHLYGNTLPFKAPPNVIIHGRVPIDQMIAETSQMQGAIRLTEFDGFSEILARSILWGQYPVSLIEYPHMLQLKDIRQILEKTEPNEGREFYQLNLNNYPWNQKRNTSSTVPGLDLVYTGDLGAIGGYETESRFSSTS